MPLAAVSGNGQPQHHKRSRSAVLRSFVAPSSKKSDNFQGQPPSSPSKKATIQPLQLDTDDFFSGLPSDHPDAMSPLGEVNNLQGRRSSPRKHSPVDQESSTKLKSLHKKNKSAVSLKSLTGRDKDKEKDKSTAQREDSRKSCDQPRPKKSKSSTSLSALLSRPKSSKGNKKESDQIQQDKENQTPPNSSSSTHAPPIWAQFSTPHTEQVSRTYKIPLNDDRDRVQEIDLCTSQEYSPSKGKSFYEREMAIPPRSEARPRPKSALVDSTTSRALSSQFAGHLQKSSTSPVKSPEKEKERSKKSISEARHRAMVTEEKVKNENVDPKKQTQKSTSRVMAAVAAFNGKNKEKEIVPSTPNEARLDPRAIDSAFEAMLESRNTADDVRQKMRGLDTNMKAEFIRQNKSSTNLSEHGQDAVRPSPGKRSRTDSVTTTKETIDGSDSPKKPRPRSLTFTLSKDSSPAKKNKERSTSHARNKSADLSTSASSKSLNGEVTGSSFLGRLQKQAVPEDFITYLRKVQAPENVEIGRVQKLRQLLRNETVAWTDSFITLGGMNEIVNLLHRILAIEWREEHEDNLLHHTLNCLKALLTTTLALNQLSSLESTLFPVLLNLLFTTGEERKAPAEFTTRNIIMSLFFVYLSGSPTPARARALLAHLRDPAPAEGSQPLGFIAEMHRPRPYKRWCTEVSNTTKEVFWIFLHSVNIIPYPSLPTTLSPDASYVQKWYPAPRPPVPAAPYVGGVEWDATTYLATHLDLLNGIIACLPEDDERNQLRLEMRDSGWEKVMGGSLRTCKEKFYGGVHAGLATYIGAARDDGWDTKAVKEGPPRDASRSPRKSPKKAADEPPKLEALPKLEVRNGGIGDWL